MIIALMTLLVLALVFVSAAGYGRAMDELFGSRGLPGTPPSPPPHLPSTRMPMAA